MGKNQTSKKAVVLLSGGLDSTTVLHLALHEGYRPHCLLVDYGQRHRAELARAKKIARAAAVPFTVVKVAFPWNGSALLAGEKKLKLGSRHSRYGDLPSTYVPGRNTVFISYALSFAETIGASTVFIGANAVDFSGYPDCRPGYYTAWNRVLKSLGTGVRIDVPLLRLNKAEIIRLGLSLGVPYHDTWSCYQGKKHPCGVCESCRLRSKGFREAGIPDPALKRPS